jgi:hypothetical protein
MLISQVQTAKDHPDSVNFYLVGFGALLLAAPGLIGAWMLRRGSDETQGIPSPPSAPSQQRPSSSHRR